MVGRVPVRGNGVHVGACLCVTVGTGQVGATGVRGGDLRAGQAIFLYPLGALHRVSGTMGYRKKI